MAEEFRALALPALGESWMNSLPRGPLSKREMKALVRQRRDADEIQLLRELVAAGSESARIMVTLDPTREIIQVVMSALRHR